MEDNWKQFHLQRDFVHDFPASLWQHKDGFIVSYATRALCAKTNTSLRTVGVFDQTETDSISYMRVLSLIPA